MVPSHTTGTSFCPGKFSDDTNTVKSAMVSTSSPLVLQEKRDRVITKA